MELDVQHALEPGAAAADALPEEADLTRWVSAALAHTEADGALTIRIVGLEEGAALNQTYRGKQGATNVLSFPAELPPEVEVDLLGDIVICAPVVLRESAEQGKTVQAHWCHLVVHGVLHLLGYDHENDAEARFMEAQECKILRDLGFADPYAAEHYESAVA